MTTAELDKLDAAVNSSRRRRRWRGMLLAALAAALGAVVWSSSLRRPCGPASGQTLGGPVIRQPSVQETIRVGTFNIRGGKGLDDRRDLERTAECLSDLDLVGLNEVHGPWLWQDQDQAEILGRKLGLAWLFAPTEERWWHYHFGNGLLTSLPVARWQRIPLARRFGESHRNVLWAVVELGGERIHVLVTHIDRSDDRDRRAQLETVAELFLSLESPAVLLGDMNSTSEDPTIRRLLAAPDVEDCLGAVLDDDPTGRIDWIFARGLETVDGAICQNGASDHPSFWAELRLRER